MRVLVCGGRDFTDHQYITGYLESRLWGYINPAIAQCEPLVIIHGAARGADSIAHLWARARGFEVLSFPADWAKYGKQAGYLRNVQMVKEGKPDLVICFPGGKGTRMMEAIARDAHITVEIPGYNGEYLPKGESPDYA